LKQELELIKSLYSESYFVEEVLFKLEPKKLKQLYTDKTWQPFVDKMFSTTLYCLKDELLDTVLEENGIDFSPTNLEVRNIEFNMMQLLEMCPIVLTSKRYTCIRRFFLKGTTQITFQMHHGDLEYADGKNRDRDLLLTPGNGVERFPFVADLFWYFIDNVLPNVTSLQVFGDEVMDDFEISPVTLPQKLSLEHLKLDVSFASLDYNRLSCHNTKEERLLFLENLSKTLKHFEYRGHGTALFFDKDFEHFFPNLETLSLVAQDKLEDIYVHCDEEHMPKISSIVIEGYDAHTSEKASPSLTELKISK